MTEEIGLLGPGNFSQGIDEIRLKLASDDPGICDVLAAEADWTRWRYLGVWTTPEYANIRFETHFFSCEFDHLDRPLINDEVAKAWWLDEEEARPLVRGRLPAHGISRHECALYPETLQPNSSVIFVRWRCDSLSAFSDADALLQRIPTAALLAMASNYMC